MEPKGSSPFQTRPIILSPPPLNSRASETFHSRRQQSVGYNLQHEFETLSADLDLDLKDDHPSSATSTQGAPLSANSINLPGNGLGPGLNSISAPATTTTTNPHSQFVNTIAPIPTNVNASQAGLGSLNQSFVTSLNLPNRPQSVDDYNLFHSHSNGQSHSQSQPQIQSPPVSGEPPEQFAPESDSSTNFYSELMRFTNWIANLDSQDNLIMADYLCNNLPIDILVSLKSKLDSHLTGSHQQLGFQSNPPQQSQQYSSVLSPYNNYSHSDITNDLEYLNLNNDRVLHQPKPKQDIRNYYQQTSSIPQNHLQFQNVYQTGTLNSRPRSADPSMHKNPNYQYLDRAKSPTNHLFEKTNFLQLAAARSPGLGPASDEGLVDMAQKLGALQTINSRVVLDSNKKIHHQHYHDPSGRLMNSNSVPLSNNQGHSKSNIKSPPNGKAQNMRKATSSPKPDTSTSTSSLTSSNTSMPQDITNIELLNNIPAWLKLLRLHKYTDCLKDIPWKQLIELDDLQLEDKGVKALGARRKLLKAFDVIKASGLQ